MQLKDQCEPGFSKWHHKSRLQNSRFFSQTARAYLNTQKYGLVCRFIIKVTLSNYPLLYGHLSNTDTLLCPLLYPNK